MIGDEFFVRTRTARLLRHIVQSNQRYIARENAKKIVKQHISALRQTAPAKLRKQLELVEERLFTATDLQQKILLEQKTETGFHKSLTEKITQLEKRLTQCLAVHKERADRIQKTEERLSQHFETNLDKKNLEEKDLEKRRHDLRKNKIVFSARKSQSRAELSAVKKGINLTELELNVLKLEQMKKQLSEELSKEQENQKLVHVEERIRKIKEKIEKMRF